MKKVIIIGSGLGALSTALRLSSLGSPVTILEKNQTPGGRLNQLNIDGFKFDIGPSFLSMSYEFDELFKSSQIPNPLRLTELDPLYQVFFEHRRTPYKIHKDFSRLEREFIDIEPDLAKKVERYLARGKRLFDGTFEEIVKSNYFSLADYLGKISQVDKRLLPFLFRNMWQEVENTFSSEELRVIFSLVAFFLGSTPFKTPAIYSLLNYVEFRHDGYWGVGGGMYKVIEELVKILKERGVEFVYDANVVKVHEQDQRARALEDQQGRLWKADLFVCNADAASFRGEVLKRPEFSPARLDKMAWSFAPFTIYLGVKGKIENAMQHNYFLGRNFKGYATKVLNSALTPQRPYYYVNVASKTYPEYAPAGCESLLILCPVPDLRFKKDWADKETFADDIISDLSKRITFDINKNTIVRKILTPKDWATMFNLYRGSGLGLCHGMTQVGYLRPKNKDEKLENLYYVGASTIPGTGLPMAIISSRLTLERIIHDHGPLS